MYTASTTRKLVLSVVAALALLAGTLLISTPRAAASQAQCTQGVCVWSQTDFGGDFSWWPGGQTGCHSHNGIAVKAIWNRSSYTVRIPGRGVSILPGSQATFDQAVTGDICWP